MLGELGEERLTRGARGGNIELTVYDSPQNGWPNSKRRGILVLKADDLERNRYFEFKPGQYEMRQLDLPIR